MSRCDVLPLLTLGAVGVGLLATVACSSNTMTQASDDETSGGHAGASARTAGGAQATGGSNATTATAGAAGKTEVSQGGAVATAGYAGLGTSGAGRDSAGGGSSGGGLASGGVGVAGSSGGELGGTAGGGGMGTASLAGRVNSANAGVTASAGQGGVGGANVGSAGVAGSSAPCCVLTDSVHCRCVSSGDGCSVAAVDADGDGVGARECAAAPGTDCNDGNATINPKATEICDGIDNDCDGKIDVFDGLLPSSLADSISNLYGPHQPEIIWAPSFSGYVVAYDVGSDEIARTRILESSGAVRGAEVALESGDQEPYALGATDTEVTIVYKDYSKSGNFFAGLDANRKLLTDRLAFGTAGGDGAVVPLGTSGEWAAALSAGSATGDAYVRSVSTGATTSTGSRWYTGFTQVASVVDKSTSRSATLFSNATSAQLQIRGSGLEPVASVAYTDLVGAANTALAAGPGQFLVLLEGAAGWRVDLVDTMGEHLCSAAATLQTNVTATPINQALGGKIGNNWVIPGVTSGGTGPNAAMLVIQDPCSGVAHVLRHSTTSCPNIDSNIAVGPKGIAQVWSCGSGLGALYARTLGPLLCNAPTP